mmetsp:Transcript_11687/g.23499  ORF Transcript_11687/g.23499 Transcript_11687/m.23499 type:complete len:269 (-) Transcript_11687:507-1313(-)
MTEAARGGSASQSTCLCRIANSVRWLQTHSVSLSESTISQPSVLQVELASLHHWHSRTLRELEPRLHSVAADPEYSVSWGNESDTLLAWPPVIVTDEIELPREYPGGSWRQLPRSLRIDVSVSVPVLRLVVSFVALVLILARILGDSASRPASVNSVFVRLVIARESVAYGASDGTRDPATLDISCSMSSSISLTAMHVVLSVLLLLSRAVPRRSPMASPTSSPTVPLLLVRISVGVFASVLLRILTSEIRTLVLAAPLLEFARFVTV